MTFLGRVGKVATRVGRTISNVGSAVKTIANSPVVRTIATGVGTAGRALTPVIGAVAPEAVPIVGAVSKGLQSGSILNTVAKSAGTATQIGQIVSKIGQNMK